MISVFNLFWIVPAAVTFGFMLCAVFAVGDKEE